MQLRFGAFGKTPDAGDFLRINVPPSVVGPWDTWLQQAMLQARQALGHRWDTAYMSAPLWRFVLSAGMAGPRPVIGVLMPSVDRVGRRFPLTLMAVLPEGADASTGLARHRATLMALEDIALDTLEDGATRVAMEQALMDMHAVDDDDTAAGQDAAGSWWETGTDTVALYIGGGWPGPAMMTRLFDPAKPLQAVGT